MVGIIVVPLIGLINPLEMLTGSDFTNFENYALIDLLADHTKKFTLLLRAGIQNQDLDSYSYTINILVKEIRSRWAKGGLPDYLEVKDEDLHFRDGGT